MSTAVAKVYNPAEVEAKWYQFWLDQGFFRSTPNPAKKPYTITIPPPNVTGVLHMGHMLNNTIQDVLIRRARMQGFEALWVPGTDHASIATEAKVVAMLKEQGIDKKAIGREEFLKHAWAWKEKYGNHIIQQLKVMGASCDWDRTRFTMEPSLSEAVIHTFVKLYNDGLIYRGVRMVNWDPVGQTAVSDEEVYHKQVNSNLYYVHYPAEDGNGGITIATTRPETIMADVAVCVHPDDERYQSLIGRKVIVPFVNRAVPVIADSYIDPSFGTGALKITPAHDLADFEIAQKYNLEVIDVLNPDGTISEKAGAFVGMDRFAARKAAAKQLEELGLLVKTEAHTNNMGYSERTNAAIEPRLSMQWFLKMDQMAKPALDAVMNDEVQLHPAKFKNMYRSWMENVHDWCISRQLWWGHRIPAYYLPNGQFVVAETLEEALALAQKLDASITAADLSQEADVLDTWFSSWLWPMSVFDGVGRESEDLDYYYPTNDLVTAPEILFFWVARMIMAGIYYTGKVPFKNVYLTGIVRDKQGRKMSKSLGNSPDTMELIAQYGADGVRTGMLFSSPAGNDLPFDEKLVEQGRNFCNKIWNAYRLVDGLPVDSQAAPSPEAQMAVAWFGQRLSATLLEVENLFEKFRISDALLACYNLVWDDFCAWYLELIKPAYGQAIDAQTLAATKDYFDQLMRLIHPFMPFISEEVWQNLQPREAGESICVATWPSPQAVDTALLATAEIAFEVIKEVRGARNARGLSPKEALPLEISGPNAHTLEAWIDCVVKLANVDLKFTQQRSEGAGIHFVVKDAECFIPMAGKVDVAEEREKLEKELEYTQGFLTSVDKKLGNESFMANAKPDVIAREEAKKADAAAKIAAIKDALAQLS